MKENEILQLLTPKALPPVPPRLKSDVMRQIRRRRTLKTFFTAKKALASVAAAAVIVAIVLVSLPHAAVQAADTSEILDRGLVAAGEVQTMVMTIDVRTAEHESFSYINPLRGMVTHTLKVVRGTSADEPTVWRLEKPGRGVLFDGRYEYMWMAGGTGVVGAADAGFEEWWGLLLNPRVVPMREKAALQEGVKYRVERSGGSVLLTAKVRAKGDFENPYMLFSSIEESPTRREISFERATGLVSSLRIWVRALGLERLVVDVRAIAYDVPLDRAALVTPPMGYQWRDTTVPVAVSAFSGISASRAAVLIAEAITSGDVATVKEVFAGMNLDLVTERFSGARVVEVGEPFRSGTFAGVFVPFKIIHAEGRTERLNLALRNDNPTGTWLVDGGF